MKNQRLFQIVHFLLRYQKATAETLAKEFGVSKRTIYRDIDALSLAGIPIYSQAGKDGGIFLASQYRLAANYLTAEEQQQLLSALTSIEQLLPEDTTPLLPKLAALFQQEPAEWLAIDFSRWGKSTDSYDFYCLKEAILHKYILHFDYINTSAIATFKTVKPLQLRYKAKGWYLIAWCCTTQCLKWYKLTRMTNITMTSQTFHEHYSLKAMSEENPTDYPTVQLLFSRQVAYRVYDEFDPQTMTHLANGDITVLTQLPIDNWLLGYLLSFMGEVRVIEPESLKQAYQASIHHLFQQENGKDDRPWQQ